MNIVQCSCLGNYGRFGNACIQYCFSRAYAEHHGAILETPDWIGSKIFEIETTPLSRTLPKTKCDRVPWGQTNIDLFGYFQNQQCLSYLSKSKIQEYLKIRPEWVERFPRREGYYIACHLRRGDYLSKVSHIYCVVKTEAYKAACEQYGLDQSKVVWVSEEEPQASDLESVGLSFLPDFLTLMQADVLLRANSTFSWMAGVLGNGEVYSPVVESLTGLQSVPFVKGNHPRLLDMANNPTETAIHTEMILKE